MGKLFDWMAASVCHLDKYLIPRNMDFTQANSARFKAPKKVIFVDTLPRDASGKLMKDQLREANTERDIFSR